MPRFAAMSTSPDAAGYLPISPIVFREKAAALLHGGDVNAVYRDTGKGVFRPSWARRTTAATPW